MAVVDLLVEEHVAYITLNDPKRANVLDAVSEHELYDTLYRCRFNKDVYVIVLQAEGKVFSGGGDVVALLAAAKDPEANKDLIDESLAKPGSISTLIRAINKPVVASIQGAVAGAAESIVLMCDFRIAAEDVLFVTPFVNIGLTTDGGGIYAISRLLGAGKAAELAILGKMIKGDEALHLGLVTELTPVEELKARTKKFAERLAHGPRLVYQYMKQQINQACYAEIENVLNTEAEYQGRCLRSADCVEGLTAFIEKRKPGFTGN